MKIVLILIVITFGINFYMIMSVEKNIINISDLSNEKYDAVLVLGCKAYSDRPSSMLANRLEKGKEVYNHTKTKIILSGDHGKDSYDEVNIMKSYMLNYNIDSKDIFLDHAGFSTYDSLYRAKNIFGAKKIIIVTQKYHMYRALYIAKKLGIDATGIVADDINNEFIMFKNEVREILSRNKNFIKVIIKPESKYLGEVISLDGDGNITNG